MSIKAANTRKIESYLSLISSYFNRSNVSSFDEDDYQDVLQILEQATCCLEGKFSDKGIKPTFNSAKTAYVDHLVTERHSKLKQFQRQALKIVPNDYNGKDNELISKVLAHGQLSHIKQYDNLISNILNLKKSSFQLITVLLSNPNEDVIDWAIDELTPEVPLSVIADGIAAADNEHAMTVFRNRTRENDPCFLFASSLSYCQTKEMVDLVLSYFSLCSGTKIKLLSELLNQSIDQNINGNKLAKQFAYVWDTLLTKELDFSTTMKQLDLTDEFYLKCDAFWYFIRLFNYDISVFKTLYTEWLSDYKERKPNVFAFDIKEDAVARMADAGALDPNFQKVNDAVLSKVLKYRGMTAYKSLINLDVSDSLLAKPLIRKVTKKDPIMDVMEDVPDWVKPFVLEIMEEGLQ